MRQQPTTNDADLFLTKLGLDDYNFADADLLNEQSIDGNHHQLEFDPQEEEDALR